MPSATNAANTYAQDHLSPSDRQSDGRSAAAEALFEEVREQQTAGNGSGTSGAYVNELTTQLQEQGLLPLVTLQWTQTADAGDLDRDGNTQENMFAVLDSDNSGDISDAEINDWRSHAEPGTLEFKLLEQLRSDYEQLRYAVSDDPQQGITMNDINTALQTENARVAEQAMLADASARLLANDDLFNALDIADDGGTPDGQISRNDIRAFLEAWDSGVRPSYVSEEDVAALRFLDQHWDGVVKDNPDTEAGDDGIRDTRDERDTQSGTGITRGSIRVNYGLPADANDQQEQEFFLQVAGTNPQFAEQYGVDVPETEEPPPTTPEVVPLTPQEQQTIVEFLNTPEGRAQYQAAAGEDGRLSATEAEQLIASYPSGTAPAGATLLATHFAELAGEDLYIAADELTALGVTPSTTPEEPDTLTPEERQRVVEFLNSESGQSILRYTAGEDGQLSWEELNELYGAYGMFGETPPQELQLLVTHFDELAGEDNVLSPEEWTALGVMTPVVEEPEMPMPSLLYEQAWEVDPGEGFDLIARQAFIQLVGRPPTPAEEIALSEMIAAGNGNDRSYSGGYIHPGDRLVIPNITELVAQAEAQGIPLVDYIRQQTPAFTAEAQARARGESQPAM